MCHAAWPWNVSFNSPPFSCILLAEFSFFPRHTVCSCDGLSLRGYRGKFGETNRRSCHLGVLEAIVLGIIQGATEFLPVSSSGHLVLAPQLLGITEPSLSYDVLLHLATSLAVMGYFFREIRNMVQAFVSPGRLGEGEAKLWRQLALWIILGTIPAGFAGVLLEDKFASLFHSTFAVGLALMITGLLLLCAEWSRTEPGKSGRWRTWECLMCS